MILNDEVYEPPAIDEATSMKNVASSHGVVKDQDNQAEYVIAKNHIIT